MRSRIFFLAIVSFWVVMNCLLWRSQWGAHSRIGSAVPVEVVWEKILSAPDSSSLDIYDHDKKVGICHWIANVGNSPLASNKILADDYAPDGQTEQVTGYSLAFEGNAKLSDSNRIRFEASLDLSTNRAWQNFHLRVSMRPRLWDIRAAAASEKVVLKVEDRGGSWKKPLSFSDLLDPETMWADFDGTAMLSLLGGAGLTPSKESLSGLAGSMALQAHEDWMQFGHSKARAYRLETVFLGRHIYLFTSRVGEILWVEFPDNITLRNEAFEHFLAIAMIEINHLTKKFGDLVAVDDLSLKVERGEFFAVLGPNAAGKTTLIRVLAGLLKPSAGTARVAGFDVQADPLEARRRLAYVPDFPFLYDKLTPWEFLRFTGHIFQMSESRIQEASRALIPRFHLEAFISRPIEGLSHGTRQRVAIVSALLHDPEVLVIDEPMVGLDPQHARVVKDVLKERTRNGVTIFLSTHQLGVAEEMADRIGIMVRGRLAAIGTGEQLRKQAGDHGALEDVFLALTSSGNGSTPSE